MEKKPILVFNNGKMKRDFTFIDDIINGTLACIKKNYKNEVFNLGNNVSENLLDMINIIEKELNQKAIIEYKKNKNRNMFILYLGYFFNGHGIV